MGSELKAAYWAAPGADVLAGCQATCQSPSDHRLKSRKKSDFPLIGLGRDVCGRQCALQSALAF